MVVFVGLLVLCCVFTLLGSKEAEASILYYDMEEDGEGASEVIPEDDGDTEASPPSKERKSRAPAPPSAEPQASSGGEQAADIAGQIYHDIDL
ncbi:hypothetical protein [uncultured Duncaniella sp.]|uniref:hypothetical protein n=1 Tax=uncultured Duncaniella sp. TaxID=2768039 RepID=UPI0025A95E1D|nr:hypothetical protein [uncultured Duncaniella sp.]